MTTYTFICLSRDGGPAAVDSADCRDDADALQIGESLFSTLPRSAGTNAHRIEAYEGGRLVRPAANA
jgi:hypothetical protein